MKNSSKGLTYKVLSVVLVSYLALVCFIAVSIYNSYIENSKRFIFNKLEAIAQTTVSLLDPSDIAYLANTYPKKDLLKNNNDDLVYYRVNKILQDIAQKNNLSSAIKILELTTNNTLETIANSDDKPNFRQLFLNAPPIILKQYNLGNNIGPYYTGKGLWLSSFHPIRDIMGKTVAILMVDQEFTEVKKAAKDEFYIFLFWGLVLTATFLAIIIPLLTKLTRNAENNEVKLSESLNLISNKNNELQLAKAEIDATNNKLLRLNEGLEKIVEDRTLNLLKANQELDQFVYSASHNLRAPLTTIMGLINLSLTEDKNETIKHYVKLMDGTVKRLDLVIRDIIDYSKNSRLKFVPEPINLSLLVTDEFENNLDKKPNEKCNLKLEIDENTPNPPVFLTDKTRITILIRNLLANALVHQNSNENCFVKVSIKINNGELELSVTDNGIGISSEIIPKIYDLFFVGNPNSKGSGIGLYIVKEVVTKLKGKIELKTQENKGTTFTVFIPELKI